MMKRLATILLPVLLSTSALALERSEQALGDLELRADWRGSCTVTLSYYNFCTGWYWVWNADPGERIGIQIERSPHWLTYCHTQVNGTLFESWLATIPGAPAGYGFTGTVELWATDSFGCLVGSPLATQPFLAGSPWTQFHWDVWVPLNFAIVHTVGSAPNNPTGFLTDHPAAGPTGPQALGHCYPADREARSFWYGTASSPVCEPLEDSAGSAELVLITIGAVHEWYPPVSVESVTWGSLKALYR